MAQRQQSILNHIKRQSMMASASSQNKESRNFPEEENFLELPEVEYKTLTYRTLQEIRKEIKQNAEHTIEEIKKIREEHNDKFNRLQESV